MTEVLFVGPPDEPDRYELGAPVGAGAEGILYRGIVRTASGARLDVAVKVLHPRFQSRIDEWRDRWVEQVELLRSLQTPGVVPVRDGFIGPSPHEAGQAQPNKTRSLYLVMNWVDGVSLDEWANDHADRSPAEKLKLLLGVAAALDVMHAGASTGGMPVIHGDIKPSNILVTPNESTVLVDFGLLRILPDGVRETGVSGTAGYMAPEVRTKGRHSPASDRYSLGGVAYFLLTGADPPGGTTETDIRRRLAEDLPTDLSMVDSVVAMMSTKSEKRPAELANWCAQLRNSSLGVDFPNTPLAPVAPPRRVARSAGATTGVNRRPPLLAACLALLVLAAAALVTRSDHTPTHRYSGAASVSSTTSGEAPTSAVAAAVAPVVAAGTACRNDKLGFTIDIPKGMSEIREGAEEFATCEGFTFDDSMIDRPNVEQAPVYVSSVTSLSMPELVDQVDGKLIDTRSVALGPLNGRVVEGRVDPDATFSEPFKHGFRTANYLVPRGNTTIIFQLFSPLSERANTYADHKRLFDQFMNSLILEKPGCLNQVSYHCGEFFWTRPPPGDNPATISIDGSPNPARVGDEVTITLKVSDPDGGDDITVLCEDYGDGSGRSPCVLARTDGYPGLFGFVRARPNKPEPGGQWNPPPPHPGSATFICRYTYTKPGDFKATFLANAFATGDDIPYGHNPYRSSKTVDVTIHVNPPETTTSTSTTPTTDYSSRAVAPRCTRA